MRPGGASVTSTRVSGPAISPPKKTPLAATVTSEPPSIREPAADRVVGPGRAAGSAGQAAGRGRGPTRTAAAGPAPAEPWAAGSETARRPPPRPAARATGRAGDPNSIAPTSPPPPRPRRLPPRRGGA